MRNYLLNDQEAGEKLRTALEIDRAPMMALRMLEKMIDAETDGPAPVSAG